MDRPTQPQRPSDAPQSLHRRATTPSISEKPQSSPIVPPSGPPNPALPSIRHLHPHLPPPAQFYSTPDASVYVSHMPRSGFEQPPAASGTTGFTTAATSQTPSELLPIPEASDSDKEQSAPPKKRRKRQALSCTECKRRKIKCDRNQPCGPCSHRNEPQKCQWHQVETNDKYVTRTEFDQLKAKVDQLESIIARLTHPSNMSSMHQAMVTNPGMSTSVGLMATYAPPQRSPSVTSVIYSSGPDLHLEPYPPTRHMSSMPSSLRVGELTSPPLDREGFSTIPRMHPPAQTPHAVRQLPPSLAAITTPFEINPDDGSKKRNAQTLIWQGERLRQSCRATHDPVPLPSKRNHHLPLLVLLQSPRSCITNLLHLLSAIVHSVIPLHLWSYLNVLGILVVIFHLHLLAVNVIMDQTTHQVPVAGRLGQLHKATVK